MASVPNLLATEESVVEASIIAARYRRPHRVHPANTPSSGWCWRSGGRDSGPAVHKPYEEARMDVDGYLVELFGRLPCLVHAAVEDCLQHVGQAAYLRGMNPGSTTPRGVGWAQRGGGATADGDGQGG